MEPPADLVEELVRDLAASTTAYKEWCYRYLTEHPDILLCRIPPGIPDAGKPMFILSNATHRLAQDGVPLYSAASIHKRLLEIVTPLEESERTCESVTTVSS